MAFDATKKEWSELYAFFRLLAEGNVYAGTPDVKRDENCCLPIAKVQREEHDGTRNYIIGKNEVRIWGENIDKRIPREDFETVANLILQALRETSGNNMTSPDGVEGFLDEIVIYNLEAKTDDRTDLKVAFYNENALLTGLSIHSRIGPLYPLLDGGRAANFHGYYDYKVREFLLAIATGMRPAKVYTGIDSAIDGCLFVTGDGELLCYQRAFRQVFADFLFQNTRLEKGSTQKDKYGYLERENGAYYFKLNLKVGLMKR